jgi:hypothetical protein
VVPSLGHSQASSYRVVRWTCLSLKSTYPQRQVSHTRLMIRSAGYPERVRELPLLTVIAVEAAGLVVVALLAHWRLGSLLMGIGLCIGALFRLTLPARQAGLLVVRSKAVDAAVLLALGFGLVALANAIPAAS